MDLSFIIVNWNTKRLLVGCLQSIKSTVINLTYEVIVLDNGSLDDSVKTVRERFPEVKVIENKQNLGFAKANNIGLSMMRGKYAVLLNTDTILKEKAIKNVVDFMDKNAEVGICGVQLLNEDGSRQNSIANIPNLMTELTNKSLLRRLFPKIYLGKGHRFSEPVEVESVIGACMVVRRDAIEKIGYLDEDYFFFLEETDWCLRFRKNGWKVFHNPHAEVFHLQGQTAKTVLIGARIEYWRSRYLFFRKHKSVVEQAVLMAGLLLKLSVDLILSFLYGVGTLFVNNRVRGKIKLYSTLILWHLRGRPGSWGLRA